MSRIVIGELTCSDSQLIDIIDMELLQGIIGGIEFLPLYDQKGNLIGYVVKPCGCVQ